MANRQLKKSKMRKRRHFRIRKQINGTPACPRLSVYRSLKHIQAQLVDDTRGRSLMGVSSTLPEIQDRLSSLSGKCEKSREIGRVLAAKALEAGITRVVFDRGGYLYHGRVKALAEGAREGGLKF